MAWAYIWGRQTDVDLNFMVHCTSKKIISHCPYISFSFTSMDRGFILGAHLGRLTESSEPYLMLTYISWLTALRKRSFDLS